MPEKMIQSSPRDQKYFLNPRGDGDDENSLESGNLWRRKKREGSSRFCYPSKKIE